MKFTIGAPVARPSRPAARTAAPQSMTAQEISDEDQMAQQAQQQEEADVSQHERDNAARAARSQKFEEDRTSVIEDYQSAENLPPRKPAEWTARGKPFTMKSMPSPWMEPKPLPEDAWQKPAKARAILDELLNRKQGRYDLSSKELTELKEEHGTNWRSAAERKLAGGK